MFLFLKKNIWSIYLIHAIDALAFSISGIFVPVFLLTSGAMVKEIALYYIIHNLVLLITALAAGVIAGKVGLKKTILFRFPFLFSFLWLLMVWEYSFSNIMILGVLSGMQAGFFWTPLNIFFGRFSNIKNLGKSIAKLSAIPQIAAMGGPFIGGLVAVFFGFQALFAITLAVSLFTALPLFLSADFDDSFKFKPFKGWEYYRKRPRLLIADIVDNIGGETEALIWPIFVFLAIQNPVSVGLVGSLAALGAFVFTLIVGNLADKKDGNYLIRLSVPVLILVWLLRTQIDTPIFIYTITLLAGFAITLFAIPYTRLFYAIAKRERNESFFVIKEIPTVAGRVVIFILFYFLADHLSWLFPIAGLSYLYFYFIKIK
jgi:MFS family permease